MQIFKINTMYVPKYFIYTTYCIKTSLVLLLFSNKRSRIYQYTAPFVYCPTELTVN